MIADAVKEKRLSWEQEKGSQAEEEDDELLSEFLDGEFDEFSATVEAENALRDRLHEIKPSYRPIFVKVSKEIPRMVGGADALSAGALWMQMIEKACACVGRGQKDKENKEIKGYKSLWYGEGSEFLERLLGVESERLGTTDPDALFEGICNCQTAGYIYNAGSGSNMGTEDGLNAGHAYTVMGGKTVGDKKYVLIRNPYSTMSLQYLEDGKKTRTGRHMDTHSDATYGQFYMEFEEFLQKFSAISRIKLPQTQPGAGAT